MNLSVVAVDVTTMTVYDYLCSDESHAELLKRAENDKAKDIATWESHCKNYPNNPTFERNLEKAKQKSYQVMTYNDYHAAKRNFYISQPLEEITAEQFDDMLNILPPNHWMTLRGVEMFCMSEMLTLTYTNQYARVGDKYYTKVVDTRDRSTWIHECIEPK